MAILRSGDLFGEGSLLDDTRKRFCVREMIETYRLGSNARRLSNDRAQYPQRCRELAVLGSFMLAGNLFMLGQAVALPALIVWTHCPFN